MDAAYHRAYRVAHRDEINARDRARRARGRVRGDRTIEYAKRPSRAATPLPTLYPETQHGRSVAFWEDELRLDLAQEAVLAEIEGRDPVEAVAVYAARETDWYNHITRDRPHRRVRRATAQARC